MRLETALEVIHQYFREQIDATPEDNQQTIFRILDDNKQICNRLKQAEQEEN